MPGFDVEGARKAGYSDDEILDHLSQTSKFDAPGALKAGYSKQELIDHLAATAPPPNPVTAGLTPRPLKDTGLTVSPGESTGSVPGDVLMGGVSSLAQIPVGGYKLLRRAIPALPAPPAYLDSWTTPPANAAGHIGEFAGDLGTFAAPGGLEEAAISKLPATGRLARAGIRAGMDALTAGSVEGVKSGGDATKTAVAAGTAGVLGGTFDAAGEPLLKAVTDLWGKATGAGGVAIRRAAADASQGLKDAMRSKIAENEIVRNLDDAARTVMTNRGNEYRQGMQQLDQTIRLSIQPVNQAVKDQMQAYGINLTRGTGKAFTGSPIVSKTDQDAMLRAIGDVFRWNDFSPSGMDTLKQRLTGYADQVSPRAQPFFYRVADAAKRELNGNVPGYTALTKGYEDASNLLQIIRKELSAGAENPGVTFRKLSNALNQHNEFKKVLLEDLDKAAGTDISGQLAGYHLRQWTPRGLAGTAAGVGAAYMHDPRILLSSAIGSPRVAGELMALVSAMRKNTPAAVSHVLGNSMSAVAPALANQILPNELTPPPANLQPPPSR